MSGDEFGRDGWTEDHPAPGHDGGAGPADPGVPDDHLSGDSPAADTAAVDESRYPEGQFDRGGDDVEELDSDGPDDRDDDGLSFDHSVDAAHLDPEPVAADAGGQPGAMPPPGSPDRWAEAIGYGAADPAGTHPGFFDHVDLSGADHEGQADPEWLTDELAGARGTWVDPELLDRSGSRESALLSRASGDEAVAGLWDRIGPDTPLPTGPSGAPDLAGALDTLEARAGATPLREVIVAARRLLDE